MVREESFVVLVEDTKKGFELAREFLQKKIPLAWRAMLECCVKELPKDRLEELLKESRIVLADAPKIVIGNGQKGLEGIFSLMKKKLQESADPEEIEGQILGLLNLAEGAGLLLVEQLKSIGMMQESIKKTQQEQGF